LYPAIEIDLHLDRICAGQRQSPAALEAAFRASTYGTNLLPHRHILAEGADHGEVIAATAEESVDAAVKPILLNPRPSSVETSAACGATERLSRICAQVPPVTA